MQKFSAAKGLAVLNRAKGLDPRLTRRTPKVAILVPAMIGVEPRTSQLSAGGCVTTRPYSSGVCKMNTGDGEWSVQPSFAPVRICCRTPHQCTSTRLFHSPPSGPIITAPAHTLGERTLEFEHSMGEIYIPSVFKHRLQGLTRGQSTSILVVMMCHIYTMAGFILNFPA
jgi:hypothetical protein